MRLVEFRLGASRSVEFQRSQFRLSQISNVNFEMVFRRSETQTSFNPESFNILNLN